MNDKYTLESWRELAGIRQGIINRLEKKIRELEKANEAWRSVAVMAVAQKNGPYTLTDPFVGFLPTPKDAPSSKRGEQASND